MEHVEMPKIIFEDKELSSNAKIIYTEIAAHCNIFGSFFGTNVYLMNKFDLSLPTIYSSFSQLTQKGYIRIETKKKQAERKIYLSHV